MVTMNITFDNPTILPALEELITNLKGVKEVTVSDDNATEIPNAETCAAIQELRAGKGIKCKNIDDLFEPISHIKQLVTLAHYYLIISIWWRTDSS
ncbi:MAG: hypothetical protein LBD52_00660 [Prevotellaceae bacterium]|jgi:Leucine-rich repeat (LRR) protein|nr:hypothetical protein [Prevotellaceae bacterium]